MARTPPKSTPSKRLAKTQATPPRTKLPRRAKGDEIEDRRWDEEAERARELVRNEEEMESGEEDEDMLDADMLDGEEDEDEYEDEEDLQEGGSAHPANPSPSRGRGGRGKRGRPRLTMKKRKAQTSAIDSTFLPATAADAYFLAHGTSQPTSSRSFSDILPPLSAQRINTLLAQVPDPPELAQLHAFHSTRLPHFLAQLQQGINILFFGFGSKRALLDEFAREHCAKKGHVAIIHGFLPSSTYTTVVSSLLSLPFVPSPSPVPSHPDTPEKLYRALSSSKRSLFIVIHSLDAAGFFTAPMRALLSLLALHPKCHLFASLDKLNSPLLFTPRELYARKHAPLSDNDGDTDSEVELPSHQPAIPAQRGFCFVWHDLTTMAHYTAELAPRAGSALASTSGGANGAHLDPVAVQHILTSVTKKAKELFQIIGQMQLDALAAPSETNLPPGVPAHAMTYANLYARARDAFLATNDVTFQSLLTEFRDHGLVGAAGAGAQEMLWVNVAEARLRGVLKGLEEQAEAGA